METPLRALLHGVRAARSPRRRVHEGSSRVARSRKAAGVWTLGFPVIAGFVLTLGVLNTPLSRAHFDSTGQYSHKTSACASSTNRADPVMDVFYNNATGANVGTHIQHHTGWQNQEGGSQWYKIHENPRVCGQNASSEQRASAGGNDDRIHVRFIKTYHGDATLGTTALATPHDEYVHFICGHAVRDPYGYQNARTAVYNNMVPAGGHTFLGSSNWGNTEEHEQCDGNWVGSIDGKVDFIRIP